MKKNLSGQFKVLLALILVIAMLLLPLDAFALGITNTGSTPDEVELSDTGASLFSGDGSQESPYLIQSSDDWNALADSVLDGTSYEGKIILLEEDITVTRSLGHADDISSASSPSYEFDGTFDGGGHTMTFTPPADSNANYVAPFSIVKNATIRNLKVEGEITAFNNLSGLVGAPKGTLMVENVLVDVDVEGNFIGGFVGHGVMADMTFRSCAFTGNLNGDTLAGGFVCWRGPIAWEASGNPALHIENCLFAGSTSGAADFHPIGFTQQTNVSAEISDMWATADGQNNGKGFYNYQYQGTSYRSTVATVVNGISSSRPWMGYFDVIDCPPVEGTFADALNVWTAGSTLALLTNVTTDSTITVPTGEHTLDLNGHGILMTGNDRVVTINQGASLELNDSDPDRIHYITLTNYRGTAVSDSGEESVSNGNGVIKVTGGYLTGGYRNNSGSHDRCGAGVYNWGTFVMNGGNIVGNTLFNNSGGGIRNSGYFTMNGGTIAFNYASGNGGGVTTYVPGGSQGKMTMNGGEISDNYCGSYGGGIQIAGPIEMTGGSVVRNTAGAGGSGVFYDGKNDRFKLSGNPVIKDNSNNDDLYLGANATFMINGSLTEEADIHVLMNTPAEFTVGWKNIMGNADPSKYFTSDDSNYAVILNNNGEAEIAPPPVASIISGDTTMKYSTLAEAVDAWTVGSTLRLLADVTTDSTVTVPSGAYTLDLNGHTLKAASSGYSVVTVGSDSVLTIDDSAESGGKITGGSVGENYGGGVTVDGGTLTLRGGAISGNANTHGGIGNCGGGVHVRAEGKYYMEGGEISDNTSYVGGGVCSDTSATTVSITGGVIKNNKTDRFGSAVWAGRSSSSIFRIGGDVQIIDNISTWTADKDGEASVNFVGELLISGNPTVHGDWKTSGTSAPNSHINLDNDGSGVQRLTLEGALTNDTGSPSITMSPIYRWNDLRNGQTFVFTKNWNKYMGTAHPADYFKLDDSLSGVTVIRKDGEAAFTGSGDLGDLYITFNANEGEGEMEPQLATTSSVTLNENTFSRKDLIFSGWNTKKDGSGTAYADKASITLTGDLTLYAQWKGPAASVISGETATSYSSFSDAVNAWSAGSTLKLLSDVTTDSTVTVPSGEHTLDLSGYELKRTGATGSDNSGLAVTVNDGVTLTVIGPGKITGGKGFHGGGIHVEGNSSLVLDNCEISGNTGHYGGGLYLSKGTITLKNGTVVKGNSASEGFGGSGIYAEGGGTLILEDSKFINNEIKNNNQYAVFLAGNANVKVSGAPVINDNTYDGKQKDLYLYQAGDQHSNVQVIGELTDGAKIIVGQTTGTGVIGSGWKANMGDVDPADYLVSADTDYVVFANKDDELEIGYPEITGVSAEGFEGDYDGEAHKISVTAPDGATIKYGTTEGSYTLTENPTYTDAGTYTVYYEVSKNKYRSTYGSADVKINKINATVTITGRSLTVDYDGKAHSADGYDAVASSNLYDVNKDFTFSGRAEAVRTNAGTTKMNLSADKFKNTNSNFATVTFNVTDGYITVNPVDVVVAITGHSDTVDYNGSAHSADGYDAVASSNLYDVHKDFTFSGRAEAVRTNAGTTKMNLSADKFKNTNTNFANVTFNVTDGFLTVNPVDAVITTAPHAKSELIYNGSEQGLIAAGAADGGTLYYALGDDAKTAPADESYATAIPTATQIGNYYIWYMVKGDSNHNDLSASCIKITMADQGWGTVSGAVVDENHSPVKNATVSLIMGGRVIDEIASGSDGSYYFTVPAGIYNIVVKSSDTTVTEMVNVSDRTTYDLTVPDSDTDSVLDIVDTDSRIVVGGLSKEAAAVRNTEGVSADQNVSVRMTVKTVSESDTTGSQAISGIAGDMFVEYYDCKVEKTVNTVTTSMDKTQTVLELVIPCSYTNKRELTVYNSDGSGAQTLTLSDSREAGTFRVDQNAGLVYIYTDRIATYAVGYKPYYSIKSEVSLGSFSGNVSVKLTKDTTGETYALNNVSLNSISFAGLPKGTYSMTITWTDGAENTLTTPFIIK